MTRSIFVNLPVRDLARSRAFFAELGLSFNDQFSDDTAACLVLGDNISAMLLSYEKFQSFAPGAICDATTHSEVLLCLTCESRDEVDEIVRRAEANGGSTFREPVDHGFMYGHAFRDPDGHIWELIWMQGE